MGLASKLPTRADLLVLAESAALPIGATRQSPNYRRKKAPFFRTRLLKYGRGGDSMGLASKLPTRAWSFSIGGIRCSANWSDSTIPKRQVQKSPVLSNEALNMAGVERFELPTRGFGIRCSANWSYTPAVRI